MDDIPAGPATVSFEQVREAAAGRGLESGGEEEIALARHRETEPGGADEEAAGEGPDGLAGVRAGAESQLLLREIAGAGEVRRELAARDDDSRFGDGRQVALDRRVHVEAAVLREPSHDGRGQGHRDLVDAELRRASDGPVAIDVGVAEGRRPHDVIAHGDGDRGAGVELEHLVQHGSRLLDGLVVRRSARHARDGQRRQPGPRRARARRCGGESSSRS